jgi:hypothetical protein
MNPLREAASLLIGLYEFLCESIGKVAALLDPLLQSARRGYLEVKYG